MTRVQIEIAIGTFVVLVAATFLLLLGLREDDRIEHITAEQEAELIEVGAALFETNCRGCHGPRGEGITGLAPPLNNVFFFTERLNEVGWQGTLQDYIIATVSTGRQQSTRPDLYPGGGVPAMPSWAERFGGPLRDDQIVNLALFILNWDQVALGEVGMPELASPPVSTDDPITRGRLVFEGNGCGACHTIEGVSEGIIGPNLTSIAVTATERVSGQTAEEYVRSSILNPGEFLVEGFDDLMPKTYGETLTEESIADLFAFLFSER